jgi:integrase
VARAHGRSARTPWHFNFAHEKKHYRFSLDKHLGRRLKSKSEAEDEAERIRIAIRDGVFGVIQPEPEPAADVLTLRTYAAEWLLTIAGRLKASTIGFYSDNLDHHVLPLLGDRPIGEIKRGDCITLITTLRGKGLKIRTIRGVVRTLSTVLTQATDEGKLDSNPALNLRNYLKRGDEAETEIDPFDAADAEHFAETARQHFPKWHPFVLCGLRTGMRLGELLGLEWGDIDWRSRTIKVRRNWTRGAITTPKNHQRRTVRMSPKLTVTLRLWRRQLRKQFLKDGLPRPEIIFPSEIGTNLDDSNVRKMFRAICEKAELRHRSPHDMRHTFATLSLLEGAPLAYVSKQLGHADKAITLRVYTHWLPDSDVEQHEAARLDLLSEKVAKQLQTRQKERAA